MDVPSATLLGKLQEGGGSATGEAATVTQCPAAPVVPQERFKGEQVSISLSQLCIFQRYSEF